MRNLHFTFLKLQLCYFRTCFNIYLAKVYVHSHNIRFHLIFTSLLSFPTPSANGVVALLCSWDRHIAH